jgi:hypothetical protein
LFNPVAGDTSDLRVRFKGNGYAVVWVVQPSGQQAEMNQVEVTGLEGQNENSRGVVVLGNGLRFNNPCPEPCPVDDVNAEASSSSSSNPDAQQQGQAAEESLATAESLLTTGLIHAELDALKDQSGAVGPPLTVDPSSLIADAALRPKQQQQQPPPPPPPQGQQLGPGLNTRAVPYALLRTNAMPFDRVYSSGHSAHGGCHSESGKCLSFLLSSCPLLSLSLSSCPLLSLSLSLFLLLSLSYPLSLSSFLLSLLPSLYN